MKDIISLILPRNRQSFSTIYVRTIFYTKSSLRSINTQYLISYSVLTSSFKKYAKNAQLSGPKIKYFSKRLRVSDSFFTAMQFVAYSAIYQAIFQPFSLSSWNLKAIGKLLWYPSFIVELYSLALFLHGFLEHCSRMDLLFYCKTQFWGPFVKDHKGDPPCIFPFANPLFSLLTKLKLCSQGWVTLAPNFYCSVTSILLRLLLSIF